MKELLLFACLFFGTVIMMAQNNKDSIVVSQDTVVYENVDKEPEFPGGERAMFQFISHKLVYPADAQDNRIQGRVILKFIVEKDGSITHIEAVINKQEEKILAKEAYRVLKSMPKWKPGLLNGVPVRTKYSLPVVFRLQ